MIQMKSNLNSLPDFGRRIKLLDYQEGFEIQIYYFFLYFFSFLFSAWFKIFKSLNFVWDDKPKAIERRLGTVVRKNSSADNPEFSSLQIILTGFFDIYLKNWENIKRKGNFLQINGDKLRRYPFRKGSIIYKGVLIFVAIIDKKLFFKWNWVLLSELSKVFDFLKIKIPSKTELVFHDQKKRAFCPKDRIIEWIIFEKFFILKKFQKFNFLRLQKTWNNANFGWKSLEQGLGQRLTKQIWQLEIFKNFMKSFLKFFLNKVNFRW